MDVFLDVEAEPSDSGDSNDDYADGHDDTGARNAPAITRGDDAPVRSPSPKRHRTSRAN